MMPMPMRRKTRDMEKVENLCRTATAWKILPARRNKPDHGCAIRCAPIRMARAIQSRHARDAGEAARHQRHDPGRGRQADLERADAAAQSLARRRRWRAAVSPGRSPCRK